MAGSAATCRVSLQLRRLCCMSCWAPLRVCATPRPADLPTGAASTTGRACRAALRGPRRRPRRAPTSRRAGGLCSAGGRKWETLFGKIRGGKRGPLREAQADPGFTLRRDGRAMRKQGAGEADDRGRRAQSSRRPCARLRAASQALVSCASSSSSQYNSISSSSFSFLPTP